MYDRCKTCNNPIYLPGVTYTGASCYYQGKHPTDVITERIVRNDVLAMENLTKAIQELTEVLRTPTITQRGED